MIQLSLEFILTGRHVSTIFDLRSWIYKT